MTLLQTRLAASMLPAPPRRVSCCCDASVSEHLELGIATAGHKAHDGVTGYCDACRQHGTAAGA